MLKKLAVLSLFALSVVTVYLGVASAARQASDQKLFEGLPTADEWLYLRQLTDDQGCWDARLIDTDQVLKINQTVKSIADPKYKKPALERLDQFLHFDGPQGRSDQCPDAQTTENILREKNLVLKK